MLRPGSKNRGWTTKGFHDSLPLPRTRATFDMLFESLTVDESLKILRLVTSNLANAAADQFASRIQSWRQAVSQQRSKAPINKTSG